MRFQSRNRTYSKNYFQHYFQNASQYNTTSTNKNPYYTPREQHQMYYGNIKFLNSTDNTTNNNAASFIAAYNRKQDLINVLTKVEYDLMQTSNILVEGKQCLAAAPHQRLDSISHNFTNVYFYVLFICCDTTV